MLFSVKGLKSNKSFQFISIMKKPNLVFLFFSVVLYSCPFGTKYKYPEGTFPKNPVNLTDFNSIYDDYNSTSPTLGGISAFCFSSNRESKGGDFNIIFKMLNVTMEKTDGKFTVGDANPEWGGYEMNINLYSAVKIINSEGNELGPYLIEAGQGTSEYIQTHPAYYKYFFLYASDKTGNLDIQFIQNLSDEHYSIPKNIRFLNSIKDDAYPTFNADSTLIYFCSNREQDFDIYSAQLHLSHDLLSELSDTSEVTITKEPVLSSSFDDKCPFILGNLIVFASNRSGGYGGFDLYYSVFVDGNWSAPVNFGDKINTPYDEYRPIVKTFYEQFTNHFMVFSSNRPGGAGGYDLYYVGINKMTE
jgi:hypothetical protein